MIPALSIIVVSYCKHMKNFPVNHIRQDGYTLDSRIFAAVGWHFTYPPGGAGFVIYGHRYGLPPCRMTKIQYICKLDKQLLANLTVALLLITKILLC